MTVLSSSREALISALIIRRCQYNEITSLRTPNKASNSGLRRGVVLGHEFIYVEKRTKETKKKLFLFEKAV